jgi:ABC-type Na+ transport system ATPase subunit NatA
MLSTLASSTDGHASVAGFDVCKDPAAIRKNIGIVPQKLTADEQTLYFATPRGLEFLDTYWKMKGFFEIFGDKKP